MNANPARFSDVLRTTMMSLKRTGGDLARQLGVHPITVYGWRGDDNKKNGAPDAQKVLRIARALALPDPLRFLMLSIKERGRVEISVDAKSDETAETAARLVEGWERLTADDLAQIRAVVERRLK